MRQLLTAGIVAVAVWLAAAPVDAGDGVALRAEAGLGGLGRPARWTPVRVAVENSGSDLTGDIVLEWGEARVYRAIDLPAPSRTVVDLFIRTSDVRSSMVVRVVSNGEAIASADVPIRIIPDDDRLVVCAAGAEQAAGADACTTTVHPDALPRSLRGYAAVDEVRMQAGAEFRLAPEQRSALRRWRAYHDLEVQDLLSRAPRAPLQASLPAGIQGATTLAVTIVLASLLGAVWIWVRADGSAMWSYAALAGAVVVGVAGGILAGRMGPGSSVLVRHATTVQQVGDGALISMRGTIEYPAFDAYAIRLLQVEGALTPRFAGSAEQWLDTTGTPVRRGTFGRANREEVEVEAVAAYAPFDVVAEGDAVRVSNRSRSALTGCRFPEGFSSRDAGTLVPGGSVTARPMEVTDAPFFSCAMPAPPLALSESHFPVRLEGVTVVSVLLPTFRAGDSP